MAIFVFQLDADPNDMYLDVVSESKEEYFAYASSPESNSDYQEMAQYFAAEPKWHDGKVVFQQIADNR